MEEVKTYTTLTPVLPMAYTDIKVEFNAVASAPDVDGIMTLKEEPEIEFNLVENDENMPDNNMGTGKQEFTQIQHIILPDTPLPRAAVTPPPQSVSPTLCSAVLSAPLLDNEPRPEFIQYVPVPNSNTSTKKCLKRKNSKDGKDGAPDPPKKRFYYDDAKLDLLCEFDTCREQFQEMDRFSAHVRDHVANMGHLTKCLWNLCSTEAADYNSLLRHIHYHAFHSKLKCHGITINEGTDGMSCVMSSEQRNTFPDMPDALICRWAGCIEDKREFTEPQLYFTHIVSHADSGIPDLEKKHKAIQCRWGACNSTPSSITKLKDHLKSHSQERKVACPICGGLFANRSKYQDHCQRQVPQESANFPCPHCPKKFAMDRLRRDHMRSHLKNGTMNKSLSSRSRSSSSSRSRSSSNASPPPPPFENLVVVNMKQEDLSAPEPDPMRQMSPPQMMPGEYEHVTVEVGPAPVQHQEQPPPMTYQHEGFVDNYPPPQAGSTTHLYNALSAPLPVSYQQQQPESVQQAYLPLPQEPLPQEAAPQFLQLEPLPPNLYYAPSPTPQVRTEQYGNYMVVDDSMNVAVEQQQEYHEIKEEFAPQPPMSNHQVQSLLHSLAPLQQQQVMLTTPGAATGMPATPQSAKAAKNGNARYGCRLCDKTFVRGNYLTKHLASHHNYGKKDGRYQYKLEEDGIHRLIE